MRLKPSVVPEHIISAWRLMLKQIRDAEGLLNKANGLFEIHARNPCISHWKQANEITSRARDIQRLAVRDMRATLAGEYGTRVRITEMGATTWRVEHWPKRMPHRSEHYTLTINTKPIK